MQVTPISSLTSQTALPGFESMANQWRLEEVLVTVKAYPNPSAKYRETCCVAGVSMTSNTWIRLYPIPFRELPNDSRFKKYQIIKIPVLRSPDKRSESHKVDLESQFTHVDTVDTGKKRDWSVRNDILLPLRSPDMESLQKGDPFTQSLGLVQVRRIKRLDLVSQDPRWSPEQLAKLRNWSRPNAPQSELEKPPFKIMYSWLCENPQCRGHRMQVFDWEVVESLRSWIRKYGENEWEEKFRQQYFDKFSTLDLHFYVGTLQRRPKTWTIIGVYYPPRLRNVVSAC